MSTHEHDTAFAAVSHLPHLIAFAFMNALIGQTNHEQMLSIAGPGFRDFSRIAGSDPLVWRDIFFSNKDNLKSQLAHFSSALQSLERALDQNDSDALVKMIELSRLARANWQINSN
jgi:prephenate dehydrogenase